MKEIVVLFESPVKRGDLARVLGCDSDREARRLLSNLQKEYNIINLQDGNGYFLADDDEALRYALQERSRAIALLEKSNAIIRRCTQGKGVEIPVRAHTRRIGR